MFAVRDGNPKKIKNWNDLLKPGVGIVTPNPLSSGAAKWNVLAAYGTQRRLGKTDKQAIAWVERMFKNVVSLDTSGRNATNSFLAGRGDVFITYENEARLAKLQYVIPRQTLLIEAPIAVIKTSENRDAANKFIRFTKIGPGAAHLRAVRFPSARPERLPGVRQAVPEAAGHLQDRRQVHRRLEGGRDRSGSTPTRASGPASRAARNSAHRSGVERRHHAPGATGATQG